MSAQGTKNENKSGSGEAMQVYCGLDVIENIVAINPTNAQKAKMYGFELDEEREEVEYTGTNEEGDEKLSLDIYYTLRGAETPRKHRFFLENTPIEFEDEATKEVKYKWVNQVGQIATAATKEELGAWFTDFQKWNNDEKQFENTGEKKTFRKCIKGEDGLMRFLREALNINYNLPSADLAYNYKKLFSGNVKELLVDLQGDMFRPFVVMTQVTVKDGEDGEKYFEKLWLPNNNFNAPTLPEEAMKHINNGCKFPTGWMGKKWKKYKETYESYPPAGFAPLESLRPYDSAEDVAAGNETKKETKSKAVAGDDGDDY